MTWPNKWISICVKRKYNLSLLNLPDYLYKGVWYMANIPRLTAVLMHDAMRSAWIQPLAVLYCPYTANLGDAWMILETGYHRNYSSKKTSFSQSAFRAWTRFIIVNKSPLCMFITIDISERRVWVLKFGQKILKSLNKKNLDEHKKLMLGIISAVIMCQMFRLQMAHLQDWHISIGIGYRLKSGMIVNSILPWFV
jgi:hypothetical protein